MTSLLAFAWRRNASNNNSSQRSKDSKEEAPASPVPPAVTASTSVETVDETSPHLKIPRPQVPRTPEGLRSRPSLDTVREELHLPQSSIERPVYQRSSSLPTYPALPPRPSSSWSTQGMMASPPISTNSFYGHDNVAESPHLLPGQARTAVGALVAQFQQSDASMSLPHFFPSWQDWSQVQLSDRENGDDNMDEEPYHDLENDAVLKTRTPLRQQRSAPNIRDSPSDSSLAASPSSLARPYPLVKTTKQDLNKSFSSQADLIRHQVTDNQYDFSPLVVPDVAGTEVVLAHPSDQTHVSGMSQSAQESFYGNSRIISHDEMDNTGPILPLDGALQRQKFLNQRRAREGLVLAAFERLQDDVALVREVEAASTSMSDWFVKTRFDQPGLLTGFAEKDRQLIVRNLNAILDEMNVVDHEEFILSPSQVPIYSEPHDDLRESLLFCRSLVQMAVPESVREDNLKSVANISQQGHWKFLPGLRGALGIIPPESPEIVRGGDTSVFSLPNDSTATPMTSNVSITTTITSANGTPSVMRARRQQADGLQIRRTIEIISTLLQKLTSACHRLSSESWSLAPEVSVRVTEEIKRSYLDLLSVQLEDMKALVDAFELDLPSMEIRREVSQDDDDGARRILPPPPVMRSAVNHHVTVPQQCSARRSYQDDEDSSDLFSPSTEDMRTWNSGVEEEQECDYYDDLRRTVGSNDYENKEELRDAPEEEREDPVNQSMNSISSCYDADDELYDGAKFVV